MTTLTNDEALAIARYAGERIPNGPLAGVLTHRYGGSDELAEAVRKIVEGYALLVEAAEIDAEIAVEVFLTTPPRPIGFVVSRKGRSVAALTGPQVRDAMRRWDELIEEARR